MRRLELEGNIREGRLGDLIVQQQRRFTMLFVITLIFALLGAAAGTVLIVLRAIH